MKKKKYFPTVYSKGVFWWHIFVWAGLADRQLETDLKQAAQKGRRKLPILHFNCIKKILIIIKKNYIYSNVLSSYSPPPPYSENRVLRILIFDFFCISIDSEWSKTYDIKRNNLNYTKSFHIHNYTFQNILNYFSFKKHNCRQGVDSPPPFSTNSFFYWSVTVLHHWYWNIIENNNPVLHYITVYNWRFRHWKLCLNWKRFFLPNNYDWSKLY